MPTLLDDSLLADTLKSLPGWEGGRDQIWRDVQLSQDDATELRREVSVDADAMGHHPTVEERDGGLRFILSTPDTGGVTELDIALAAHISDLIHRMTGQQGIDAVRKGEAVATVRAAEEEDVSGPEERGAPEDAIAPEQGVPQTEPEAGRRPMSTGAGAGPLVDDDPGVPDPDLPLLGDRPGPESGTR